ncbi:nicotinate-nucleotide adenylyltransferase [Pseudoxanthomonas sacheonensis]|uniref:nicotinate-nucleotide adenylyltransferase n=1 Tax=Pseudoxanthomonas sacheonensis TaxID=443615 RepID=UPI0013D8AC03|nr:nicotinate-nucleotide adenylyltransferase [Pseudoxanthomonas sacheonensis]KAF1707587.1 nicotinic acid mononucleotide adenylyltransferase [Pseudoxanthomonas sacheonensis]
MLKLFYGGTFDPVHNGHVAIARAARDELGCRVRLMPAADPPHRAPPGADAGQRAEMLDLAVADEPGLLVDRRELQRQGRSYSIDTLRGLRAEFGPGMPIALLVGADSFVGLPTWREWEALFGFAHFVVAPRPGSPLDGELSPELTAAVAGRWTDSPQTLKTTPAGRLFLLNQPLHPESASDIRRRIAHGEPWQGLVPPAVAGFIARNGLYSQPAPGPSPL